MRLGKRDFGAAWSLNLTMRRLIVGFAYSTTAQHVVFYNRKRAAGGYFFSSFLARARGRRPWLFSYHTQSGPLPEWNTGKGPVHLRGI